MSSGTRGAYPNSPSASKLLALRRAPDLSQAKLTGSGGETQATSRPGIRALPTDKISEVEDFVDFLQHMKGVELLTKHAVSKLSEAAFENAWCNDDDAEYDKL